MELLKRYRWPGNVRELQSVLQKAMLLTTGPVVVPDCLPPELFTSQPAAQSLPADGATTDFARFLSEHSDGTNDLYAQSVQWLERHLLCRVLQEVDGNQSKAAQRAGHHPRQPPPQTPQPRHHRSCGGRPDVAALSQLGVGNRSGKTVGL